MPQEPGLVPMPSDRPFPSTQSRRPTALPPPPRGPAPPVAFRTAREHRLALVLEASGDGYWDWDLDTGRLQFGAGAAAFLRYGDAEQEIGTPGLRELIHPEEWEETVALLEAHHGGKSPFFEVEHRLRARDGSWRWTHTRGRVTERGADGQPTRMSGTVTDIGARKAIELTLRRRDAVLEAVSLGAELLLNARSWESAVAEVLGWLGAATGADRTLLFTTEFGGSTGSTERLCCAWQPPGAGSRRRGGCDDVLPLSSLGVARWVELLSRGEVLHGSAESFPANERRVLDVQGIRSLAVLPVLVNGRRWGHLRFDMLHEAHAWSDIEIRALRAASRILGAAVHRTEAEHALRQLSLTDELTGLSNRRGFLHLAEQQWKIARQKGQDVVLLFMDLDAFKHVNDRHGHAVGDEALRATADALRSCYRKSDLIARLGGDEFVVMAVEAACDDAFLTDRIRRAMDQLNDERRFPFSLTLSIGVVRADSRAGVSLESLLERADERMYRMKRSREPSAG
jgi:diguanylate cyclase (GGDEF)-like protein/PAS domain S-box-containing protein